MYDPFCDDSIPNLLSDNASYRSSLCPYYQLKTSRKAIPTCAATCRLERLS